MNSSSATTRSRQTLGQGEVDLSSHPPPQLHLSTLLSPHQQTHHPPHPSPLPSTLVPPPSLAAFWLLFHKGASFLENNFWKAAGCGNENTDATNRRAGSSMKCMVWGKLHLPHSHHFPSHAKEGFRSDDITVPSNSGILKLE